MPYNRRKIVQLGLGVVPVAAALCHLHRASAATPKPDRRIGGIELGVIAPYSFRGMGNNPEELLKAIVRLGLSSVELQSDAIEPWAGSPAGGFGGQRGGPSGGPPGGPGAGRGGGPGAGRGGGGPVLNLPGLREAQQAAVREFGEALATRHQALVAARSALNAATFAERADPADIKAKATRVAAAELEYRIPEGSNTMAELEKCVQFCRNALA